MILGKKRVAKRAVRFLGWLVGLMVCACLYKLLRWSAAISFGKHGGDLIAGGLIILLWNLYAQLDLIKKHLTQTRAETFELDGKMEALKEFVCETEPLAAGYRSFGEKGYGGGVRHGFNANCGCGSFDDKSRAYTERVRFEKTFREENNALSESQELENLGEPHYSLFLRVQKHIVPRLKRIMREESDKHLVVRPVMEDHIEWLKRPRPWWELIGFLEWFIPELRNPRLGDGVVSDPGKKLVARIETWFAAWKGNQERIAESILSAIKREKPHGQ